ncbi:nucleotidyltransferase family protein [Sulfodiicoccus acidiphilus]|nr:nucleotidyltransferase family protein [Sulfodiicoccus acidiphilus]
MLDVGAVVLAGGEGRRFGSNKLLVDVDGRPLLWWVLEAVSHLDRVVVVGKYYREIIAAFPSEVAIYNPRYSEGMSSSVKLGLNFFARKEAILFVPGDMPLLRRDTVNRILSATSPECDAVVPVHEGTRGNPVLIMKRLFPELLLISGDVGARNVINRHKACYVECGREVIIDVDYPTDLSSFRQPA